MSEAPHVPFTETKAPESAERLHRGALGLVDIAASTMAKIGPAYSFMFGFGLLVITAGHTNSLDALNFFFESSTMGTILLLVVYFLGNLALPFYYRRYRPQEFNVVKHLILPVLGMAAIAVPVYYLCKPGQPQPYSWFPYAALGIIVVSIVYAVVLVRRDPGVGERVGSIVADE